MKSATTNTQMLLPADNHHDTWAWLQMFSLSHQHPGCVPGDEHSVWPVSGLGVLWSVGIVGWAWLEGQYLKARESCGKIHGNILKYDTSKNNFLQAVELMHCETNRAFTINLREEKKLGVAGSVENISCDLFYFFGLFLCYMALIDWRAWLWGGGCRVEGIN